MLKLPTIFFVISFAVLALLHYVSITLSLYWFYWWLDLPMHFLGGAVVALGIFTLADLRLYITERHVALVPLLLLALIVMLSWEVFELWAGIMIEADYALDTFLDIIMGLSGAVTGWYVARSIRTL